MYIFTENNTSVIKVLSQTRLMALDPFLPHDGECGHVQSDPGAWLKLCLVQLQNKEMLRDETFHDLRRKQSVSYLDPLPAVLNNINHLMPVCYVRISGQNLPVFDTQPHIEVHWWL